MSQRVDAGPFEATVLDPAACRAIEPMLAAAPDDRVWCYRYAHPETGWRLSVATYGAPDSGKLSLGGFRIAPESRTSIPGYDNDREAIELAMGMEEKVYWSRLIGVGGPLARRNADRIVGGKCVLLPTADARVGQPRDAALLDWAIACMQDMEARSGVYINTGQDLGHGTMSDGRTGSLQYMRDRFRGSMVSDTSKPTGEGNFRILEGMLRGCGIPLAEARVGLIGYGNIGHHILERLLEHGVGRVVVMEAAPRKLDELRGRGVEAWTPDRKDDFLRLPLDAVVVNAAGGTLDPHAIAIIAANPEVKVVCGSENLTMPDPRGADTLRRARKAYAPTELGGMMGYLTAVEEYLSRAEGRELDVATLYEAARKLEAVGFEATRLVRERGFERSFEDAVREIYGRAA